jgi:HlyD family secretion protein
MMPNNHRNRKKLVTVVVFALGASGVASGQTVTVRAEFRDVTSDISVTGKVVPAESSEISPARDMVISRFLVVPGQYVKKGQKLAEIDIKSVASELKYLRPYREVASRNVQLTEINLKVAQERLERTTTLAGKGIVKGNDLDQAKGGASSARRSYEQSLAQLADIESKITEVDQRLAEIALVSPQDGYIAQMVVDPRNMQGIYAARQGAVLMRIDRPGTYLMQVKTSDRDFLRLGEFPVCKVRLAYTAPVPCHLMPPTGIPERSAQAVSAVFPVAAKFEFTERNIPSGIEGVLRLAAAAPQRRLLIPWNAVEVEPGKTFVRRPGDAKGQRTAVSLGWRDGYYVEVLDGLREGDEVVAQLWPPVKVKI